MSGAASSDDARLDGPVRELFVYLIVRDAPAAIRFYAEVFGAREGLLLAEPDGRVAHAELRMGPALVMLADERPEDGLLSPLAHGGTGVTVHLHVDDVDAMAARAVARGAVLVRPPRDEPHGERQCRLRDPFGHAWLLGHPLEDVSDEKITRRYAAMSAGPVASE